MSCLYLHFTATFQFVFYKVCNRLTFGGMNMYLWGGYILVFVNQWDVSSQGVGACGVGTGCVFQLRAAG